MRTKAHWRRTMVPLRLQAMAATGLGEALQRQALAALPGLVTGDLHLGLYWPLAGEADLRPLQGPLAGRLALPCIAAGSPPGPMVYRAWNPPGPLQPDALGIPAPGPGPELPAPQLGLLLAPALALDDRGIRLGYGGGWFDRLRSDPAWRRIPALAVLPSACRTDRLPHDPWDVPFDGWLDEQGLHWLQAV